MSRHRREDVSVGLVRILGPFIGQAMARASVDGQWDKLNLGAEAEDDGVEQLLAALAPGLNVFVGRKKGEALMAEAALAVGVSMSARKP